MISQRIRQLRLARGMTLDVLAAQMGGVVTKQALSKYEKGKATPTPLVLNKLAVALNVKAAHLWEAPSWRIDFIGYRKGSGLTKRAQANVESLAAESLNDRIRIQLLASMNGGLNLPVMGYDIKSLDDAELRAEELRVHWKLGRDPIANLTSLLEEHFVHVLLIPAEDKFDGISAVAYDGKKSIAALTVSKSGVSGERQRFNLAHELGHLALKPEAGLDEEKAAHRFGAALLAPADAIRQDVGRKRESIGLQELLLLKKKYGMSMQALLFRFRDLGIITAAHFSQRFRDISANGWRREEPEALPPERPEWFQRTTLRAASEGLISPGEAERLLGEKSPLAMSVDHIERKAFMKLPLEERRRLLHAQAEAMASYYENDKGWREWEEADLARH